MARSKEAFAELPVEPKGEDESVTQLAMKLFVVNWNPMTNYTFESLVKKCFEAAESFAQVRINRQ